MKLTIDFETRGTVDLPKSGEWVYAESPDTEVSCLAIKVDSEPPRIWIPDRWANKACGEGTIRSTMSARGIPMIHYLYEVAELVNRADIIEAHNVGFERAVWHHCMADDSRGVPDLPFEKLRCSAAKAAMHGLPRGLGQVAEVLGLAQQKDQDGYRIMMKMCKPRNPTKNNPSRWHEDPEDFIRLCQYCLQDVETEHAVSAALRDLSAEELEIWRLDQEINARGLYIDREGAKAMLDMVAATEGELFAEFRELVGYKVDSPKQVQLTLDWLRDNGLDLEDLSKNTVEEALRGDLPAKVRRVLEIRLEASKASTAKYKAMLVGVNDDGRARGTSMYHGASTGRDTGKRIQPLNMPRGSLKHHEVEACIGHAKAGRYAFVDAVYGSPTEVASSCLRGVLCAAPGNELIAADYSSIEGRVLAWLAGELGVVQNYRDGLCAYKVAATVLFNKPYEAITKAERQCGKPSDLGCGYGGGIGAYATMAAAYGVDISGIYDTLLPRVSREQLDKAERMAEYYLSKSPGKLTEKEAIGADLAKQLWRESHPASVSFWYELEEAAIGAVDRPGQVFDCRGVRFVCQGGFLYMRLPSGRLMHYCHPQLKTARDDFDRMKTSLTYMTVDSYTRKWERVHTYGGKLAENLVQATARDFFYHGAMQVTKAGYPIVLRVYDELVAEVPKGFGSLDEFCALMADVPRWGEGCPVVAEGWRGERYRKD